MAKCARADCPGTGIWMPVLVIRKSQKEKPRRAQLLETLQCEYHKNHGQLADFLSEEGWDKISKFMRESGFGRFVKNLTTLDWVPTEKEAEWLPF